MSWKECQHWRGYLVSESGEVANKKTGHILKPHIEKSGYVHVWLNRGYGNSAVHVHRLVAETFIPNPENKPFVDHINTIRSDNRVENLRWTTPLENANNETTKINRRKR